MIRVEHLTKRYGAHTAVDDLSFELRPGAVTGFLGPNGSGKSTTMRCILGLDHPTSGRVTFGGVEYAKLPSPLTTVGALLDGKAFHRKRSARQHLVNVARTHGIPTRRVDEVLELTGLSGVAKRKAGEFSLGMSQRLGIAGALLGDPDVLMFDEPVNGLDPDGVRWIRTLMRGLAAEGRTVLVSSHLMSEMALTADDLIIIGRGKLIASGPMEKFTDSTKHTTVCVAGPDMDAIERAIRQANLPCERHAPDPVHPYGMILVPEKLGREVGPLLHAAGCELHLLSEEHPSLEDIYMELTNGAAEYTNPTARMPGASGATQGAMPGLAPAGQAPVPGVPAQPMSVQPVPAQAMQAQAAPTQTMQAQAAPTQAAQTAPDLAPAQGAPGLAPTQAAPTTVELHADGRHHAPKGTATPGLPAEGKEGQR